MAKKDPSLKTVVTLKHEDATRKNIPTAEHQSVIKQDDAAPLSVTSVIDGKRGRSDQGK